MTKRTPVEVGQVRRSPAGTDFRVLNVRRLGNRGFRVYLLRTTGPRLDIQRGRSEVERWEVVNHAVEEREPLTDITGCDV